MSLFCYIVITGIVAPFFYQRLHVIGQFAGEIHLLVGRGMHESQCACVQRLTGTEFETVLDKLTVAACALAT